MYLFEGSICRVLAEGYKHNYFSNSGWLCCTRIYDVFVLIILTDYCVVFIRLDKPICLKKSTPYVIYVGVYEGAKLDYVHFLLRVFLLTNFPTNFIEAHNLMGGTISKGYITSSDHSVQS